MRLLWVLLLSSLAAAPAAGQDHGAAVDPETRPSPVQPSPLTAPPLDARLVPAAAPAEAVEPRDREEPQDRGDAGRSAVLDEHFWRSVLAGVIVTVVSTLILRVIL